MQGVMYTVIGYHVLRARHFQKIWTRKSVSPVKQGWYRTMSSIWQVQVVWRW